LLEQAPQRTRNGLDLARLTRVGGIDLLALPVQRSVALGHVRHGHARRALDQDLDRAIRQLQQLQHLRERADGVQVRGCGVVGFGGLLRQQDDALVGFHRLLQRAHGLVATDEQRDDHVREHHHVA